MGIETKKCLNCNQSDFVIQQYDGGKRDGEIHIVCTNCYDDILDITKHCKELTSSLDVEPINY